MPKVTMYTTAVCPYCVRAKQVLKARGVQEIDEIRVDLQPEERQK
jgi:glutaredoxin 3